MRYPSPLVEATLLRRYKRFLADVRMTDGTELTVHCANSGAMTGCWAPGVPCRLWDSANPKRKLRWSLEQTYVDGTWIAVNTARPNGVVAEAIAQGRVPELAGYPELQTEKRYGSENSRIDILLLDGERRAYVEVKSATLQQGGHILFPDAVTTRGAKHLRELAQMVREGHRGVLVFHVGRADGHLVRPATHIDPAYAAELRRAVEAGVEVLAYRASMDSSELVLTERLPVEVPGA